MSDEKKLLADGKYDSESFSAEKDSTPERILRRPRSRIADSSPKPKTSAWVCVSLLIDSK